MKRADPVLTLAAPPTRSLMRALVSLGLGVRVGDEARPDAAGLSEVLRAVAEARVTLIVGPSGSGKSTLLRAVRATVPGAVVPRPPRGSGRLWDLAVRCAGERGAGPTLASAGLAEGALLARRVRDLSEGQRFRAGLMAALARGSGPIVADEFAAVLDAPTARALAHTFARACRRARRALVVASPRDDLARPLDADLIVNLEALSRPALKAPRS